MRIFLLTTAAVAGLNSAAAHAQTVEKPGLSPELFAAPGYSCTANLYVSSKGNDSTGDGSQARPWASLQRADASAPRAGTCVNVLPGVYNPPAGGEITLSHGGNANSATGYVVYRSTTLGGAVLRAVQAYGGGIMSLSASYLWLDGFEIDGNATGCGGAPCVGDYNVGFLTSSKIHHQWLTNNYSHGGGGGGFGAARGGDCAWLVHNVASNNAATSGYEESGISIYEAHAVKGVMSCGSSPFHLQILWNISHNNLEGPAIAAGLHTDGDGIILDTFKASKYPYQTLVANNLAYDNGGFCVGEDNSSFITFANNTCYNNYIDPINAGTYRAELWAYGGKSNVFINNVVQSIPGAGILANNVTALSYGTASATSWTHNILFGPNPRDYTNHHTDPISCTSNACATNPLWVAPGSLNFALQAGSPAIGYGLSESYLPASDVDAGACGGSLGTCP